MQKFRRWSAISSIKKHLPKTITCIPYTFDTSFDGEFIINRYNWMENEKVAL